MQWVTPQGSHVVKTLQRAVLNKANENTGADVQQGANFDPDAENRAGEMVRMAVGEVRGAIAQGGQFPLSATAGTVPPEFEAHALNIAAWRMINSTPNLGMFLLTEKGAYSPFAQLYKEAQDAVQRLREGESFTQPDDPTGRDYETAVDADTNPAVATIRHGGMHGAIDQDLTTEDFNPDTV